MDKELKYDHFLKCSYLTCGTFGDGHGTKYGQGVGCGIGHGDGFYEGHGHGDDLYFGILWGGCDGTGDGAANRNGSGNG